MILLVGAWYNEVGYKFNFSHKVDNFIREQIKAVIFPKYKLNDLEKDYYLNLNVATDSTIQNLEVRGPGIRKRAKMIDYGLWFPHDAINKSAYPLESYIDYYFDALEIVFSNYNVPGEEFKDLKIRCKKEILNNPEYLYIESL